MTKTENPNGGSTQIKGQYVTLELINQSHIASLFKYLGFPDNKQIVDYVQGFPYVENEEELANHLFGSLREHPDLTIYVIKACEAQLGPPSLSDSNSHTSVLGICGYRLDPPANIAKLDDIIHSPLLQRTYAATEAQYLMHRQLFEGLPVAYRRVWVVSNSFNFRSRQYTERIGYKYEGTFRKDKITRWGTTRDSDCLSMLDEEWPINKRVLLKWLNSANFDTYGKQIKKLDEIRAQEL
ncbi:hypothetical protein N7478_012384 [Penicillium angulare]|uniref:uncharacterized protein n=1 Tax=Penicillium angulare TaxID=116970 RepID=UPI0025411EB2|nr:uncharacterized protein N7478_012384 [Penicillium angulare]KAJ5259403.1 hypothetical protein N7478_012384 [Penicillium angulare]